MRDYPALRIEFFSPPTDDQRDLLSAALDDFNLTALNETPNGVVAFFGSATARDAALASLESYELIDAVAEDVPDENWAERSQAALTPVTVGRLTIAPPWTVTDEMKDTAPDPIIIIQPSMGFGTGHHASTRLCLELLQLLPLSAKCVLDVGTGSGVLAIAARELGAVVTAIDIDADALENARENLALNFVASGVELMETDLSGLNERAGEFDVILANLTGGLLLRSVASLTTLAAPDSRLIVSGFQVHERAEVEDAFLSAEWKVDDSREADSWVGILFRRQRR